MWNIVYDRVAWFWLDTQSWELISLENNNSSKNVSSKVINETWNILNSNVSRSASIITWKFSEKIVSIILGAKLIKANNNPYFDAILKDGSKLEIKWARVWNATILKRDQLNWIPKDWYYSIIFYRINWWDSPTCTLSKSTELKLKRNMVFSDLFLFSIPQMIFCYNSSNLPVQHKWSYGQEFKHFRYENAKKWSKFFNFRQSVFDKWRHHINLHINRDYIG